MRIALKSAYAMLRRKKIESLLIAITIMLTSLLIYIGLSLMNQSEPFAEMYERANGSENLLFVNSKVNDVEDIASWLEDNESVKSVSVFNSFNSNVEFYNDNNKISSNLLITEFIENSTQDIVYINDSELAKAPKNDEIYISYNFAKNNNLAIGDKLSVKLNEQIYNLRVAQLVVDPQYNNGFMSPFRSFVAIDFFEKHEIESNISLIGIKYHEYTVEKEKHLKSDFDNYMLDSIQPTFIGYSQIDQAYNMISNIIASALVLVSLFMFMIVIFIIRVTIRNQIIGQYKIIGVRKVLGYSSKQIRQTFIFMYIMIGFVASTVGSLIGIPLRVSIEKSLTEDLKVGTSNSYGTYIIITIIIIVILLLLFVTLAANKASKVKPIQAIKYGVPENKTQRTSFSVNTLTKIPLTLVLAIKQLLMDKRKSFISITSIMLITFVTLTISNITGSMSNEKHFSQYLIGMKTGDISLTDSSNRPINEIIKELESIENINTAVFNSKELSANTLSKDGTENIPLLGTIIYGNPDENLVILSEGRQPMEPNEIIISNPVAKEAGKTVGDYITIKRPNGEMNYLVTGLYDSVIHSGKSYLIIDRDFSESNIVNGYYWLYFDNKSVIMDDIEYSIQELLGDEVTVEEFDRDTQQIVGTIKSMPYVSNMIITIFLIVCGIIIFNWTLIDISRSTKVYGIFKATGFSNSQIRTLLIVKSLFLTLIGIISGYIISALTIQSVMTGMFSITPFSTIELPVNFSHSQGLMIITLYSLIALLATLIPTRRIAKISPKTLITE